MGEILFNRSYLLLGLLVLVGCNPVKTTITRTSNNSYPGRPKGSEILVLTQAPSNRKNEEIAILTTLASTPWTVPLVSGFDPKTGKDLNDMLPSLKEAARKLGADAILIKSVAPGSFEQGSTGKAFAVAIKFLD